MQRSSPETGHFPKMLSAPLLGVGLELLLERRELGKGRIRIRGLVPAVAAVVAALEVLGPQLRITLGAIAAPGPIGSAVALRTPATISPVLVGARQAGAVLIGTVLIRSILVGAILIGTPATMPAWPAVLSGSIRNLAGGRHGLAGRDRGHRVGPGGRLCPFGIFGTRLRDT